MRERNHNNEIMAIVDWITFEIWLHFGSAFNQLIKLHRKTMFAEQECVAAACLPASQPVDAPVPTKIRIYKNKAKE